ncbi:MAG: hypothetical protein QF415_17210 [Candidatus Undinarchaeales archaeon]|nr:hypothetical protein [Candidatus Undinarchaeales archaeon]
MMTIDQRNAFISCETAGYLPGDKDGRQGFIPLHETGNGSCLSNFIQEEGAAPMSLKTKEDDRCDKWRFRRMGEHHHPF